MTPGKNEDFTPFGDMRVPPNDGHELTGLRELGSILNDTYKLMGAWRKSVEDVLVRCKSDLKDAREKAGPAVEHAKVKSFLSVVHHHDIYSAPMPVRQVMCEILEWLTIKYRSIV